MLNAGFVFPVAALALGILTSAYFLIEWWRAHRRPRFLLLWAVALFLMYWFQVPTILTGPGKVITVTDFNLFFALTLPITFVALVLVYIGSLEVVGSRLKGRTRTWFLCWFLFAVIFFAYHFIMRKGVIETHTLPFVGNVAFYLPIRMLILFIFVRWLSGPTPKGAYGVLGAAAVIGEGVIGIFRNFLVLKTILVYPPQFWYVALTSSKAFFLLQTLSIILLALGFSLLYRMHQRLRS